MKRFLSLCSLLVVFSAFPLHADEMDYSIYDGLLRAYVSSDGLVNYESLRTNSRNDLKTYLQQLASAKLKGLIYEEKLAFWINAYNANMIQLIMDHPEIEKIDEHSEIFDIPINIAGGQYSLNDIEYRIIRGKINKSNNKGPIRRVTLEIFDPRVHFALYNGAVDCPKLQNFAYTSHNVDATLRANSINFVSSTKYLRIENGQLRLSSLMKWYADDFQIVGGAPVFLSRIVNLTERPDADAIKKLLATQYDKTDFEYDWTVNDIEIAPPPATNVLKAPQ